MGFQTYNFQSVVALVADGDTHATDISLRILRGFGVEQALSARSGEEVKQMLLAGKRVDLLVCEALLSDMRGEDLVEWIRRQEDQDFRCIPIVIVTGHTQPQNVLALRDSGANGVICKPIAAGQLFDRIVWAASSERKFVISESYVGPDRRFRNVGPPNGVGRRATDLSATVGDAVDPNLSQDEIDCFIKPMKVSIE